MRKTILITMIILPTVMIAFALYRYLPLFTGLIPSGKGIHAENLEASGAGTIELHLTERHRALVLIVPDRRMDRHWNTNNLETQVGLRLARILNERGVDTAAFDRADAGLPPENFETPARIEEQIANAFNALTHYRDSRPQLQGTPILILAHGDGCLASLSAVSTHRLEPERLLLFGCAYGDTLLESYGNLVLNTMRLHGVAPAQIQAAQQEWNSWIRQKEYEQIAPDEWIRRQKKMLEENVHPDTVAFRKTLAVFQRPENHPWLLAAKGLSFREKVESTLKRTRVIIEQYPAEYDEEAPNASLEKNRDSAAGFGPRFFFRSLPQTDHFLFERTTPPASPVENMMSRNNPFKDFSPAFLRVLDEHWP